VGVVVKEDLVLLGRGRGLNIGILKWTRVETEADKEIELTVTDKGCKATDM